MNPYAPPKTATPEAPRYLKRPRGYQRHRSLILLTPPLAALPHRCVLTNSEDDLEVREILIESTKISPMFMLLLVIGFVPLVSILHLLNIIDFAIPIVIIYTALSLFFWMKKNPKERCFLQFCINKQQLAKRQCMRKIQIGLRVCAFLALFFSSHSYQPILWLFLLTTFCFPNPLHKIRAGKLIDGQPSAKGCSKLFLDSL